MYVSLIVRLFSWSGPKSVNPIKRVGSSLYGEATAPSYQKITVDFLWQCQALGVN